MSLLLATMLAASLTGCGTINSLEEGGKEGAGRVWIYGGLYFDVALLASRDRIPDLDFIVVPLLVLDLPLSLAADTITLPFTIPLQLFWTPPIPEGDPSAPLENRSP